MMLEGKIAIITGAGSGMGRASALRFAREGASIVCAELNPTTGQETVDMVKKEGGNAVFVQCDVSDEESVKNLIKKSVEAFGKIDCVFNCAGFPQTPAPIEECPTELFDKIFAVNVKGIWMMSKYALPELKKTKGNIINVASVGGLRPRAGSTIYGPSKGAVISLTKATAVEFGQYGVRVNVLLPGPVNTPMLPKFIVDDFNEDVLKQVKAGTLLGTLIEPEDIASAGAYLASDEASKVTGMEFFIDAGSYCGGRGKN